MALITDPERARRKARAIVSYVLVYNPEKLKEGIENDSVFEVLDDAIEEGRELYKSLVDQEILDSTNYYDMAIVDVLVKPGGRHESKIW